MNSIPSYNEKIASARLLLIGAGGIGCELLKNLALTGFRNVTIIDLDTIDISNLNRQFLFRKEHVGRPKAEIATFAICQMVPEMKIKFYHDSIMSETFGLDFFKSFSFVLSALDNKAARSHVNRLCLVSGVPLIESGSSGYLGQVSVILKGKTECYDCVPKAAQKTFPSCTIRNTPTELIHCVVWAKSLFNQLFGEEDPDDDVAPDISDENENNAQNVDSQLSNGENLLNGSQVETATNPSNSNVSFHRISTRQFAEKNSYAAKFLFDKLFYDDINYLLSMAHLWKDRKKPNPITFDEIISGGMGGSKKGTQNDVWSSSKWAEVFEESVRELYSNFKETQAKNGVLAFDKDDAPALNFVAACSNIRASIFNLRGKSLFEIKAMAGNIIPAIATTNACVAGMVLVEALKIVRGEMDRCRWVYINKQPNPKGKILVDEKPQQPKSNCYVCSDKREVVVQLDLEKMQAGQLRDKLLIGNLNMIQPDVMELFSNRIIISSEEGETDGIMGKTLKSLGIQNGAQLECDDFQQRLNFKLILLHSDKITDDEFEIQGAALPDVSKTNINNDQEITASVEQSSVTTDNGHSPSPAKKSRVG